MTFLIDKYFNNVKKINDLIFLNLNHTQIPPPPLLFSPSRETKTVSYAMWCVHRRPSHPPKATEYFIHVLLYTVWPALISTFSFL